MLYGNRISEFLSASHPFLKNEIAPFGNSALPSLHSAVFQFSTFFFSIKL
jgi:hypothetical protein